MVKYIGKRLLTSIITIWAVVTIVFFLVRLMPGGPFDGEKITPEMKAQLNEKYGLDKPVGEQYTMYMKNLLKGDLGQSMAYKGRKVGSIIEKSFPNSAKVGVASIIFSVAVAIPSFVMGTFLIFIFTTNLKLLPATGLSTPSRYIMPVLALSGSSMAFITRLTRSKLIDVLKSDYIRTAKAKGLSGRTIIFKHALRNSLIPVVTYLGPLVAGVLTGSFVVEKIFAIPGLGNEFTTTITNRDYTSLLGVTVFYCTLIVVSNLLVDIIYVLIDPRIKLES